MLQWLYIVHAIYSLPGGRVHEKGVNRMIYKKKFKATIINGPSKMDLLTAFAYAYSKEHDFSVTFYMVDEDENLKERLWYKIAGKDGAPLKARIIGISYEDGSGNKFLIEGYLDYYCNKKTDYSVHFTAYYSSFNRKGTAELELNFADEK